MNTQRSIDWTTLAEGFTFLAAIINNQPDEQVVAQLRTAFEPLAADENASSDDGYSKMGQFWQAQAARSNQDLAETLAVEWMHLFRGLSSTLGAKPPYAGVYCAVDGIGIELIMNIKRAYGEYELAIAETKRDRPDYLGFQLDFIAYLADRAANSTAEQETAINNSVQNFLAAYLTPWLNQFIENALPYAQTLFFQGYLQMLQDSVQELTDFVN